MRFKIIEVNFPSTSDETLPMCKDARKDPVFRGECLTIKRPAPEDYVDDSVVNDLMEEGSNDTQFRQTLTVSSRPCPPNSGKDHRGNCRKVTKFELNLTIN